MLGLFRQAKAGDPDLTLAKTHDFCASGKPELTVVFIHGIASDSRTFTNALRFLEGTLALEAVRFVAFDLLGSGESVSSDLLNYDYRDQVTALHNAILKLKSDTPLVLVGHSMGTLIATKYADTYKKAVRELILISPPVYTAQNLEDPVLAAQMAAFKKVVAAKDSKYAHDVAFDREVEKIILNKYNYGRLAGLTTPAVLIYSEADEIIAPFNIRKVVRENPKHLRAITTVGTHRVARDKYAKIPEILVEILNESK